MIELFLAVIAGLISFLSPCVLPLIPGYISYISGSSLGELIEKKNVNLVRKSIVASQMISKNEKFTKRNITTKRPGNGISPMRFKKILGKKAKKSFLKDEIIFV